MATHFPVAQSKPSPGSPPGYKGPRGAILVELKRAGGLSSTELAAKLGTSLNAIRHHLKELEAEALIEYQRQRRGVGAPVFVYRLSAAGEALFPQRYEATLLQVLDHMVAREGRAAAAAVLESQFIQLSRRLKPQLDGAPAAERVEAVTRALVEEGFMAEWEGSEAGGRLTEHNCAIRAVAQRFPEICAAEARFFEEMLGAVVERQAHLLNGCNACEYSVHFAPPEASAPQQHTDVASWDHTGADKEQS